MKRSKLMAGVLLCGVALCGSLAGWLLSGWQSGHPDLYEKVVFQMDRGFHCLGQMNVSASILADMDGQTLGLPVSVNFTYDGTCLNGQEHGLLSTEMSFVGQKIYYGAETYWTGTEGYVRTGEVADYYGFWKRTASRPQGVDFDALFSRDMLSGSSELTDTEWTLEADPAVLLEVSGVSDLVQESLADLVEAEPDDFEVDMQEAEALYVFLPDGTPQEVRLENVVWNVRGHAVTASYVLTFDQWDEVSASAVQAPDEALQTELTADPDNLFFHDSDEDSQE